MNDYSGFSLIELLITLTVLFIVLAIARVDVIHSATKDDVRLVLRIDGAGNIRLCNPSRPTDHPEACH